MASIDIRNFYSIQKAVDCGLFSLFFQHGFGIRFVGGCVRDALLGISIHDVDLATTATPVQMAEIFTNEGMKWIPTGIDFGTITVVLDNIPFQITSLREDWQTDGRRALVRFGTSWEEDAKRRDFTFNALYADEQGHIIDYFGGHNDLQAGVVRFIGNAEDRIREDYLRILRYFRFYARFGKTLPPSELITLLAQHRKGLDRLSAERVTDEIIKLLSTQYPLYSLHLMEQALIFPDIFGCHFKPSSLEALLILEKTLDLSPNPLRRLQCLQPSLETIMTRLVLSKAQKKNYEEVVTLKKKLSVIPPPLKDCYASNHHTVKEAYILKLGEAISENVLSQDKAIASAQSFLATPWEKPLFPLTSQHLIGLGVKPGPSLGAILKACEQWWVDLEFKPDLKACLQWVKENFPNN